MKIPLADRIFFFIVLIEKISWWFHLRNIIEMCWIDHRGAAADQSESWCHSKIKVKVDVILRSKWKLMSFYDRSESWCHSRIKVKVDVILIRQHGHWTVVKNIFHFWPIKVKYKKITFFSPKIFSRTSNFFCPKKIKSFFAFFEAEKTKVH